MPILQVGVAAGLASVPQLSGGVPKGYLRVLVFNKDSALVRQRTWQLSQAANGGYEPLGDTVRVSQDGYVSVYVGNESNVEVLFDDVSVEHHSGLQVQENQYEPWGLNLAGVDYASPGIRGLNQYQFNGKERQLDLGLGWSDYGARFYAPARGPIWNGVDLLADAVSSWSPYVFTMNNAVRYTDMTGMLPGLEPDAELKVAPHKGFMEHNPSGYIAQGGPGKPAGNNATGQGTKLPVYNGVPNVSISQEVEVIGHPVAEGPNWANYALKHYATALPNGHLDGRNPYMPYNPDVVGMEVSGSVSMAGFSITGKVGFGLTNYGLLSYGALDTGFNIDNLAPNLGASANVFIADRISNRAPANQFGPFLGLSRYYSATAGVIAGGYSYTVDRYGNKDLAGYQSYSLGVGSGFSFSTGQTIAAPIPILSFGNPFSSLTRGVTPK